VKPIVRAEWPDRVLDPADLDALAEFWLDLVEPSRKALDQMRAVEYAHALELRLWGFPRSQTAAVADALRGRVEGRDAEVTTPDPDTVAVAFREADLNTLPPRGLGLPRLAGPPFDGLAVEVRLVARAYKRGGGRLIADAATVLGGRLTPAGLDLKGVWRAGAGGHEEGRDVSGKAKQADFLADFDAWRDTGDRPERNWAVLFPDASADRSVVRINRWLAADFTRPRAGMVLARTLVLALLLAPGAYIVATAPDGWLSQLTAWFLFGLAALLNVLNLGFELFFLTVARFLGGYNYRLIYSEPASLEPVALAAVGLADDPAAKKFSADLEALGGQWIEDLRLVVAVPGLFVLRVYRMPADGTVAVLALKPKAPNIGFTGAVTTDCNWPADMNLMFQTFFADGHRLATTNTLEDAFRKKRSGPEHVGRVFPLERDAARLWAAHEAERARLVEDGHPPEKHRPPAAVRQQLLDDFDDEREAYRGREFTWGDAIHLWLGWPRAAFRGRLPD
jgi:hypothetical protein